MRRYSELENLKHVYLEDSFVLRISEDSDSLVFHLEIVLIEGHPQFAPPRRGEQYCYRKGRLVFPEKAVVEWLSGSTLPSVDSDGEMDFGNIDSFTEEEGCYALSGDWGTIRVRSGIPQVQFGN